MKSRRKSPAPRAAQHPLLAYSRSSPRVTKLRPASPLYPSLDFPNRDSLVPIEAARRLGCSIQHVYNLIIEGHLHAIDISRPGRSDKRRFFRIPIESWRKFLSDRSL